MDDVNLHLSPQGSSGCPRANETEEYQAHYSILNNEVCRSRHTDKEKTSLDKAQGMGWTYQESNTFHPGHA